MSMDKVLLVHSDEEFPGGTRFLLGLRSGLQQLGIQAKLLVLCHRLDTGAIPFSDICVVCPEIGVPRLETYLGSLRVLRRLLFDRPDAVVLYGALWTTALPAILATKILCKPISIVCGEIGFVGKRGLKGMVDRFLELRLLGFASAILCLSSETRDYLRKAIGNGRCIERICNIADPIRREGQPGEPVKVEVKEKLEGKSIIAYAGSCAEYSGASDLWHALPLLAFKFPNLAVLFIGPEDCAPSRLKESGLVIATGWIPFDEVGAYLRLAHVGVTTARLCVVNRFKDPIKTYEYLAHGLPVVAARIGGSAEVIEASGGGLLYEPGDPKDLALRLETLLANSEQRSLMGLRGKSHVEHYNNPRTVAANIMRIMRRLPSDSSHAVPDSPRPSPSLPTAIGNQTRSIGSIHIKRR